MRRLNPGHIGGRQVLAPLGQRCHHGMKLILIIILEVIILIYAPEFFHLPDISMSYRASVVKVPDYSSSSFSTEGFAVYKNVQTGQN